MIKSYIKAMKEYTNFNGVATKKEYWSFMGIYIILMIVLFIGESFVMEMIPAYDKFDIPVLTNLFILISLVPSIAVSVRRLHDIEKSGWWYLINFIPFGFIIYLIFMLRKGVQNNNTEE